MLSKISHIFFDWDYKASPPRGLLMYEIQTHILVQQLAEFAQIYPKIAPSPPPATYPLMYANIMLVCFSSDVM